MAARPPQKPWEQVNRPSSSTTSSHAPSSWPNISDSPSPPMGPAPRAGASIHIRNTQSSPTTTSTTSSSPLTTPPPLPTRPRGPSNTYGSSSLGYSSLGRRDIGSGYGASRYGGGYGGYGSNYGSSYGSSYGSYGGYGGYGSSYGSPYGSNYGRYGMNNYGRYGNDGFPPQKPGEIGYSWINDLQYFADGFARFSQLLDANCDAMYGSLASVLRLLENFTQLRREIFYILNAITFLGVLRKLWSWVMGNSHSSSEQPSLPPSATSTTTDISPSSFSEFQNQQKSGANTTAGRSSLWPLRLFFLLAVIIGGPILVGRLLHFLIGNRKRNKLNIEDNNDAWKTTDLDNKVKALYDFRGHSPDEISFKKDDVLLILQQPMEDWLEAETHDGERGLVPANYVEPLRPFRN